MRIKGYTDFSLSRSGVKSLTSPDVYWGVYFKLDSEVSDLFPFINASFQDAQFLDAPQRVQFQLNSIRCTLYPREVLAAAFENEDRAREFADSLVDLLNRLDGRKTSIIPEYQPRRIVSPVNIYKLLPQTNCRKCGFPTCVAFAAYVGRGMAAPERCPGFSKPLYRQSVFPVYDNEGNISSTFSILAPPPDRSDPDQADYGGAIYHRTQTELTEREIQVLRFVAKGATNNEISEKLFISPHTVKSHIIHIFNKLNVNDRTQAAVWAAQHKII